MPYLMQMMGCAVSLLGLVLVVWLGFWMLVVMAVLSACYWLWLWLVKKGIMNPMPGVPMDNVVMREEEVRTTTVIEGDYERVDEENKPQ